MINNLNVILFIKIMKYYDIEYNGNIYSLDKEPTESNDVFMSRLWYISKKEPKDIVEFEKYKNLSLIWRNIRYYNVTYDKSIIDEL